MKVSTAKTLFLNANYDFEETSNLAVNDLDNLILHMLEDHVDMESIHYGVCHVAQELRAVVERFKSIERVVIESTNKS